MNLTFQKKTEVYEKLNSIETLRKKLSTDLRPWECRMQVKSCDEISWAYITNGAYMLKTRIPNDIPDGIYKIIKDKKEINLIPDNDCNFPNVSEVENSCTAYGEPVVFKQSRIRGTTEENISSSFCQLVRDIREDERLNFMLFYPIFNFTHFAYYQICKQPDIHKPVKLFDSEIDPTSIAYIMPMWA